MKSRVTNIAKSPRCWDVRSELQNRNFTKQKCECGKFWHLQIRLASRPLPSTPALTETSLRLRRRQLAGGNCQCCLHRHLRLQMHDRGRATVVWGVCGRNIRFIPDGPFCQWTLRWELISAK